MEGPLAMKSRGGLGAELTLVTLVLATMAGALGLIAVAHRRSIAQKPSPASIAQIAAVEAIPKPTGPPKPPPPKPEPEVPSEDPTPRAVATITEQADAEAKKGRRG